MKALLAWWNYAIVDHWATWNIFEDFQTGGVPAALKHWLMAFSRCVEVKHGWNPILSLTELSCTKEAVSCACFVVSSAMLIFAKRFTCLLWKAPIWKYHWSWPWNALVQLDSWCCSFHGFLVGQPGCPVLTVKVENMMSWRFRKNNSYRVTPKIRTVSGWYTLLSLTGERPARPRAEISIWLRSSSYWKWQALRLNTGNTTHYITDYQGLVGCS